jgi:hypothetical protein
LREAATRRLDLTLEAAGIEFTNGNQPGVRMKAGWGDIAKGISVYRVFIELPDDVADEELVPLVTQLLKDGVQSHVRVDTIEFEIAKQIAANFPRAVVTNQDRTKLATEIMGLARASRLWKGPES